MTHKGRSVRAWTLRLRIAEELGCSADQVELEAVDAGRSFDNGLYRYAIDAGTIGVNRAPGSSRIIVEFPRERVEATDADISELARAAVRAYRPAHTHA